MKQGVKIYINKDVLTSARERISLMFDRFENICCSLSGGKDSTVLLHLALEEAKRRNRKVNVFFLDQEAEYSHTIDIIDYYMRLPNVVPYWYQVPIKMRNVTSYTEEYLNAWGIGEKWMRPKSDISIHEVNAEYNDRFYDFIDWFEEQWDKEKTCFLVGLRAEESLNRFRAVTKYPGIDDLMWTTNTKGKIKVYPLYDWTFEDIWIYIAQNNVPYNKIYDFMYKLNFGMNEMRVSNLIHIHAFKCLSSLPEFEPDTYNTLLERIGGVHIAARYSKEAVMYDTKKLPSKFKTWKEYRDFLLETTPLEHKDIFIKRFAKQPNHERTYRGQCKQLLLNGWGNGIPVPTASTIKQYEDKKKKQIEEWSKIL